MTEPLADRFAEANTSSIDLDGDEVHALVEIEVDAGSELVVRRRSVGADVPQGIVVDAAIGTLHVGEFRGPAVTLWSDTAPDEVVVAIEPSERESTTVRLWNVWRDQGVVQAWLGNAGIRRLDDGPVQLRCSDGRGDISFEDLELEIECRPATSD